MTTQPTRDQQSTRPEPQSLDLPDLPARDAAASAADVRGGYGFLGRSGRPPKYGTYEPPGNW